MIYKFLRWFASLGIKFYYKNVFIYSKTPISNDHPNLFVSNHPAGFYEALMLVTLLKKPVNFLVRSDYVNIKGLKWFFKIIKLHPIYRQTEGLKNVRKNKEVFSFLNDKLKMDAQICIYPEGTTKFQYVLMPVKKGVARLAIGAIKDDVKNLDIIPIAFNFTEPAEFRSYLTVFSEEPLKLNDTMYSDENDIKNLKDLTSIIKDKMLSVALHFKNKNRQTIFKKIQLLFINNQIQEKKYKVYDRTSEIPKKIKSLSSKIDDLDDEIFNQTEYKINQYFNSISHTSDFAVISKPNSFLDYLKLFFGFPVYILGIALNIVPLLIIYYIRKTKVKKYEYKAVLTVVLGQFLYLFYFLFLLTISYFAFSEYALFIFVLPILLWFSVKYFDFLNNFKSKTKFQKSKNKDIIKQNRNELIKLLEL